MLIAMPPLCVYADTSVYGGVFDEEEFADARQGIL